MTRIGFDYHSKSLLNIRLTIIKHLYWAHVTLGRLYKTVLVEISFSSLSRVLASQVGRPGLILGGQEDGLFHHFQSVHINTEIALYFLPWMELNIQQVSMETKTTTFENNRGVPNWLC